MSLSGRPPLFDKRRGKGDACFQVRAPSNPKWFRTEKKPESEQKDQGVARALALAILKIL